jgi:membrane protease subunit (stomatin/prohibitin family)
MVDLRIEKRNGAMVWKQEIKKLEKDTVVRVDDGCVALCFAGGVNVGEFRDGQNELLNQGGRLSKQYKKANFSFIVFNREKPASVKWGVGKTPVTYEDRKLGGIALSISAYGHCDVVIHDASKLWSKMPSEYTEDNMVEAEEIESFIQKEIIAKVAPILSKELNRIGDYTKVTAAINDLSRAITFQMPDLQHMGLHLEKVVIEGLKFTDESEEIIEKHKESKVAKLDTDIAHERAEQLKSVLDAVSGREDR